MTIDRHLLGDIGLAVLLAMPTLGLSRPQPMVEHDTVAAGTPLLEQAALVERSQLERRFSLPG